MSRLQDALNRRLSQGGKVLIPYLVAGDPDLETTLGLMHALVQAGADVIELGMPFSDPASDGPVIQQATERALAGGTRLRDVLTLMHRFRAEDTQTPVVLMGYLNPVEIMGYAAFAEAAQQAGVDGVLLVDLPPGEAAQVSAPLRARGIDTVFLVAPTTRPERAAQIVEHCSGYLYYVSLKGVTGAALTDSRDIETHLGQVRELTRLPVVIGFGIKDPASALAMARLADGVVIGSALVAKIAELPAGQPRDSAALAQTVAVIQACRDALNTLENT